jgi:hypothetical protein
MPVELYRDAILTTDIPAHGLRAGDVGTVVERHDVPAKEVGYSVEFFDMTPYLSPRCESPLPPTVPPREAPRPLRHESRPNEKTSEGGVKVYGARG